MARSVRPTRSWWPLLLLLAGMGCVVLALLEARRSSRANDAIAERTLLGYARFAVWSYREHLAGRLEGAIREVLGAVNHGDATHVSPRIPAASELGEYLHFSPTCGCHLPRLGPVPVAFYGFTIGADTVGVGPNYARPGEPGWLTVPPGSPAPPLPAVRMPDEEGRWFSAELTRTARRGVARQGYWLQVFGMGGQPRFIAATLMPTSWGDTVVYAAEYSRAAMDSILEGVLEDPALLPFEPSTDPRRNATVNREVLSLQVEAPSGVSLLAWAVPSTWTYPATSRLAESHGGLILKAEIQRAAADQLLATGLPPSRWPFLLALLALAVALTLAAALQLRRELQFAASRSDFIASVSHELRTPLTQVRLMLDTIRLGRREEPAARAAALLMIDREVLRLQHLTESVLRFARGEDSGPATALETVDVSGEVAQIVAEFEPLASARGMSLAVEPSPGAMVRAHPGALRQTLLNLLDNAVKYGAPGQTIRVRIGIDGASVRLEVEDQGAGVRPEERERIWEPYQRGSVAAARAAGGSGIGLTVVRQIAEGHGGSAHVVASSAGGACFRVTLPRVTG